MADETVTLEPALTKAEKAAQLREKLKNGRNRGVNTPGDSSQGDAGSSSKQARTDFQNARREVEQLGTEYAGRRFNAEGSSGGNRNNGRGAEGEPGGYRSPGRRSDEDDSGFVNVPASQRAGANRGRAIGNLETDEPIIPRRQEPPGPEASFAGQVDEKLLKKYPAARAILEQDPGISTRQLKVRMAGAISQGTAVAIKQEWLLLHPEPEPAKRSIKMPDILRTEKFTDKEAGEKAEALKAALEDNFRYLDQYLHGRLKAAAQAKGEKDWDDSAVWDDMDEKDLDKLTKTMIRGAKHSAAMATVVNATIESADYVSVGVLIGPRVQETVQIMRETRGVRKKRGRRHADRD